MITGYNAMHPNFKPNSILHLRKEMDMSQSKLANELGCTVGCVRNWERERAAPSGFFIDKIHRICRERNVDPPEFFHINIDPNSEPTYTRPNKGKFGRF
jgi:transcriptional regulator with XRE-family HTH domain